MNLYGEVTVLVYLIEWFSFDHRQSKAKVITCTLTNHSTAS